MAALVTVSVPPAVVKSMRRAKRTPMPTDPLPAATGTPPALMTGLTSMRYGGVRAIPP